MLSLLNEDSVLCLSNVITITKQKYSLLIWTFPFFGSQPSSCRKHLEAIVSPPAENHWPKKRTISHQTNYEEAERTLGRQHVPVQTDTPDEAGKSSFSITANKRYNNSKLTCYILRFSDKLIVAFIILWLQLLLIMRWCSICQWYFSLLFLILRPAILFEEGKTAQINLLFP